MRHDPATGQTPSGVPLYDPTNPGKGIALCGDLMKRAAGWNATPWPSALQHEIALKMHHARLRCDMKRAAARVLRAATAFDIMAPNGTIETAVANAVLGPVMDYKAAIEAVEREGAHDG